MATRTYTFGLFWNSSCFTCLLDHVSPEWSLYKFSSKINFKVTFRLTESCCDPKNGGQNNSASSHANDLFTLFTDVISRRLKHEVISRRLKHYQAVLTYKALKRWQVISARRGLIADCIENKFYTRYCPAVYCHSSHLFLRELNEVQLISTGNEFDGHFACVSWSKVKKAKELGLHSGQHILNTVYTNQTRDAIHGGNII